MSSRFLPESLTNLVKRSPGRGACRSHRHVISPPELLEPRNAPGALWLLPALPGLDDDSFDPLSTVLTPESTRDTATHDEELASGAFLPDGSQSTTLRVDQDWSSLLSNDAQQDGPQSSSALAGGRHSEPLFDVDDSGLDLLGIASSAVDRPTVKLAFAADSRSDEQKPSENFPIVAAPTFALPSPPPSSSASGGGAASSGGGGSSGGGHTVQPPTLRSSGNAVVPAAAAPTVSASTAAAPQAPPKVAATSAVVSVASGEKVAVAPAPVAPAKIAPVVPAPIPVQAPVPVSVVAAAAVAPVSQAAPPQVAAAVVASVAQTSSVPSLLDVGPVIEADEVEQLLDRASAATSRTDAIIAVVDRRGQILGVRVEDDVPITDQDTLVFAIDGAVAKARTAAFFSSDSAPLTSRTVRFISQSTITEREVESNPNIADLTSTERGPGFVAPIGLGGHFPPGVQFTPQVDLFAIEHTNRDSVIHPGAGLTAGYPGRRQFDDPFSRRFRCGPRYSRTRVLRLCFRTVARRAEPRHRHAARRRPALQS